MTHKQSFALINYYILEMETFQKIRERCFEFLNESIIHFNHHHFIYTIFKKQKKQNTLTKEKK